VEFSCDHRKLRITVWPTTSMSIWARSWRYVSGTWWYSFGCKRPQTKIPRQSLEDQCQDYPVPGLVNIQNTVENHHFWWVNQRTKWQFSIAKLVYQMVIKLSHIFVYIPISSHSPFLRSSTLKWSLVGYSSVKESCSPSASSIKTRAKSSWRKSTAIHMGKSHGNPQDPQGGTCWGNLLGETRWGNLLTYKFTCPSGFSGHLPWFVDVPKCHL